MLTLPLGQRQRKHKQHKYPCYCCCYCIRLTPYGLVNAALQDQIANIRPTMFGYNLSEQSPSRSLPPASSAPRCHWHAANTGSDWCQLASAVNWENL
jgi:hypothetical protein